VVKGAGGRSSAWRLPWRLQARAGSPIYRPRGDCLPGQGIGLGSKGRTAPGGDLARVSLSLPPLFHYAAAGGRVVPFPFLHPTPPLSPPKPLLAPTQTPIFSLLPLCRRRRRAMASATDWSCG
jgi:hypothetical protein